MERLAESRASLWIFQETRHNRRKCLQILLLQEFDGTSTRKELGIADLMIVCHPRERHHDHSLPECSKFREHARSGSRHDDVGKRIEVREFFTDR